MGSGPKFWRRGRELSLLRQAHLEGFLDCREARVLDRQWWRKVHWTLDWLEDQNRNQLRKLSHELNCSLLDYFTGDKSVDLHWDQALDIQARISKTLLPWERQRAEGYSRNQFKDLVKLWEVVFGKRNDAKTEEKIRHTVKVLSSQKPTGRGL